MGYSIEIVVPKGKILPDVKEPVVGLSGSYNIVKLVQKLGFEQLNNLDTDSQIEAICSYIKELDLGNKGQFNDSMVREFEEAWYSKIENSKYFQDYETLTQLDYLAKIAPHYSTYETYAGYRWREDERKLAVRFFLYLKAGYEIKMTW